MKYKCMHFNSSCSYAALAMLVSEYEIETEDVNIALEMGLPWLFDKEDDVFLAGPGLQGAKWFDLYLNPRGFAMHEELVAKESLAEHLKKNGNCMLGLKLHEGQGKHAVVLCGYDGTYHFFNPVHEGSTESTKIELTEEELLSAAEKVTVVGTVEKCPETEHDRSVLFNKSIAVLRENVADIIKFCKAAHAPEEYVESMNRLFRPILLDAVTMLGIAGEGVLAEEFRGLQTEYLKFMKSDKAGVLADYISINRLNDLTEQYIKLIEKHI